MDIRLAEPRDAAAINEIYNHYVAHSTATYHTEPVSPEERLVWLAAHGPIHPVTVAEEDGLVLGWASLSPFHPRPAYRFTVENSVYVRPGLHGRGLGSALMADLLGRAAGAGHRSIVALIDAGQGASIRLHRRFGFEEAGRLKAVGFKFGCWLDVVYMQLLLHAGGCTNAPAGRAYLPGQSGHPDCPGSSGVPVVVSLERRRRNPGCGRRPRQDGGGRENVNRPALPRGPIHVVGPARRSVGAPHAGEDARLSLTSPSPSVNR